MYMGIKVRLLRLSDIVQVVSGWNTCLLYDRISEEWFENIVFGFLTSPMGNA